MCPSTAARYFMLARPRRPGVIACSKFFATQPGTCNSKRSFRSNERQPRAGGPTAMVPEPYILESNHLDLSVRQVGLSLFVSRVIGPLIDLRKHRRRFNWTSHLFVLNEINLNFLIVENSRELYPYDLVPIGYSKELRNLYYSLASVTL